MFRLIELNPQVYVSIFRIEPYFIRSIAIFRLNYSSIFILEPQTLPPMMKD